MRDWSEIWTRIINGPVKFSEKIAELLGEGKNILVDIPKNLCWREEMRNAMQERIETEVADCELEIVDVREEVETSPLVYLLDRCTVRTKLRHTMNVYEFLRDGCLEEGKRNLIFWFKGIPEERVREFIDFLHEYSSKMKDGCPLLLVEARGNFKVSKTLPSRVVRMHWSDHVRPYDISSFCNILAGEEEGIDEHYKDYLATLCSAVCVGDAELCACLMTEYAQELQEKGIEEALHLVQADGRFSARGEEEVGLNISEQHILYILRTGDAEELDRRIRHAQIAVLYPILELQRENFIRRYEGNLTVFLQTEPISSYDGRILDPYDLEWGRLYYISTATNAAQFLNREYEVTKTMKEIRNDLSHLKCCTPEKVRYLLTRAQEE